MRKKLDICFRCLLRFGTTITLLNNLRLEWLRANGTSNKGYAIVSQNQKHRFIVKHGIKAIMYFTVRPYRRQPEVNEIKKNN